MIEERHTESPTGFTYREKAWWRISPEHAPRKVVLAALREAKHTGFSHTNGHGGTSKEIRDLLTTAVRKYHRQVAFDARADFEADHGSSLPASKVNEYLQSLPDLEPL